MNEKINSILGKLSYWFDRSSRYQSIFRTALLLGIYYETNRSILSVLPIAFIIGCATLWFDRRFIIPNHNRYSYFMSPPAKEMYERIKRIEIMLDRGFEVDV